MVRISARLWRRMGGAIGIGVLVALTAGCTGSDPKPTTTVSTSVSPSSTASTSSLPPTPTASTIASPTSSGASGMPAAAKAHTPAGAVAFVRYFFDSVDRAWRIPSTTIIPALCLPSVEDCVNLQKTAVDLKSAGQHYVGKTIEVASLQYVGKTAGRDTVEMHGLGNTGKLVDSVGAPVSSDPEVALALQYDLTWTSGGWRIANGYKVTTK